MICNRNITNKSNCNWSDFHPLSLFPFLLSKKHSFVKLSVLDTHFVPNKNVKNHLFINMTGAENQNEKEKGKLHVWTRKPITTTKLKKSIDGRAKNKGLPVLRMLKFYSLIRKIYFPSLDATIVENWIFRY